MKKIISTLLAVSIISVMLAVLCMAEFKASFKLTGPSSARAGDTVQIRFTADGTGIVGILAEIKYDPGKLTYQSTSSALKNWRVEVNESSGTLQIWAEENNNFKSPIKSESTVIALNFKLYAKATASEKITVSANIKQASDGVDELNDISASYTLTVARPLSADSKLKALSIEGYELEPAFSPSVTEYKIKGDVLYTAAALKINAAANYSEASVDISGSRLSVGENTVRITVKAEDGKSTTVYTVKAVMQQDPDYVASSDASLSTLSVSYGMISPAFSPDVKAYAVYLPFEITEATVNGVPNDKKASAETSGPELLEVGENVYTVVCTAENGDTEQYLVTVVRMPEYGVETDTQTGTDTEEQTETETETEPYTEQTEQTAQATETEPVTETTEPAQPDDTTGPESDKNSFVEAFTQSVPLYLVVIAAVAALAVGVVGCILVMNSVKERK